MNKTIEKIFDRICSGQGAVAALLIIVGMPLVILLTVHLMKSIWGIRPKTAPAPAGN
ncbi:MAG: hypothetical protein M3Q95_11750 [Bacteroidota bacterium]|nr:hypothetical protein [Bacteroidota bacterium]